jgi:hypothetical protein
VATIGRNDPCPCGSAKKFKRCHEGNWPEGTAGARRDLLAEVDLRTAVHEAGHAIACAVLGRRFEAVSLATTTDEVSTLAGPAKWTSTIGVQFSDTWNEESIACYAAGKLDVGDLLIALAGGAAEAKLVGAASNMIKQGMWGDFQNTGYAITKGLESAGDPDSDEQLVRAIIGAALARAGAFVDAHVVAIRATATELVAKRSLTFDEVLAILRNTCREP